MIGTSASRAVSSRRGEARTASPAARTRGRRAASPGAARHRGRASRPKKSCVSCSARPMRAQRVDDRSRRQDRSLRLRQRRKNGQRRRPDRRARQRSISASNAAMSVAASDRSCEPPCRARRKSACERRGPLSVSSTSANVRGANARGRCAGRFSCRAPDRVPGLMLTSVYGPIFSCTQDSLRVSAITGPSAGIVLDDLSAVGAKTRARRLRRSGLRSAPLR